MGVCDAAAIGPTSGRAGGKPLAVLEVLEATEGGTRRHLLDLVTRLDAARFRVSVACSVSRDPGFAVDVRDLREHGIAVHVIPMRRAIRPLSDALALARLTRLMRDGRYDVVHTHSSKAGFLGRLAARLAGVPRVIHTPHTFAFRMEVGPVQRCAYRWLEGLAARMTDRLICVCPAQRADAEALAGPGRTVVIENGIGGAKIPNAGDVARCRQAAGIDEHSLVAGVIGRISRQKGPDIFAEAARRVASRLPAARFLWVGDGDRRAFLERAIREAGLTGTFHLPGASDEAVDWLTLMDVVVLPSLWEGLPYVLLDAMAAGKAVVAARVGGIPDVVTDGVNGMLVPPRDAAALAAAMVKLLENRGLRSTIGMQAQRSMDDRYRVERMVRCIEREYEGRPQG